MLEAYDTQCARWPTAGRHILAQYDDEGIVVYQAYRPAIGRFAAEHGHFGGEFSFARMTWIKPNFLWMMYRSGWGTKEGQEVTLAITLHRSYFDALLTAAVPSSFVPELFDSREAWWTAVKRSNVRLQWDPDHTPFGGKLERRAIQIGIRGETLQGFRGEGILTIEDVSGLVSAQRENRGKPALMTPRERVYRPSEAIAERLGLDPKEEEA